MYGMVSIVNNTVIYTKNSYKEQILNVLTMKKQW